MLTSLPRYYTSANDETEHVLPACQTAYSCVQSSAGQVGDGVEPSCEEQQVSRVSQKKRTPKYQKKGKPQSFYYCYILYHLQDSYGVFLVGDTCALLKNGEELPSFCSYTCSE